MFQVCGTLIIVSSRSNTKNECKKHTIVAPFGASSSEGGEEEFHLRASVGVLVERFTMVELYLLV